MILTILFSERYFSDMLELSAIKLLYPERRESEFYNKHSFGAPKCIHAFFYKNKLYKNTKAQIIWPKIKNRLRTSLA